MTIKEYLQIMRKEWEREIRIVFTSGEILEGFPNGYTSALDNDPDGESITIYTDDVPFTEIYTEDIREVQLL